MRKAKQISHRNRSPFGWWIARYIERFEWKREDRSNLDRRCLAYENTILVQAKEREHAYRKARAVRKSYSSKWRLYGETPEASRLGRWVFEGLSMLIPIYEELEDGAEILWSAYSRKRVRTVRSWIKQKTQLETFRDN